MREADPPAFCCGAGPSQVPEMSAAILFPFNSSGMNVVVFFVRILRTGIIQIVLFVSIFLPSGLVPAAVTAAC